MPAKKKPDKKGEKQVTSKRAEEAKKKELLEGAGAGRLKVLETLHCTGVLASRVLSRDVRIEQVTLSLYGRELIRDATVQINFGRRYGLIGANGSGKSSLLAALACRELPIPDHIDIWHVHQEAAPTETSALDSVVDTAAKEYARLEELIMKLSEEDAEANGEIIEALADKQDKMDPSAFIPAAGALLHGLGFSESMMHKATKDMSGGWRMRVALAQALFKKPTLLILDEPTNHLDLGACVWLEEYLAAYPSTIILTSHSEDFMNTVCTEIMQLTADQKLVYWGGNYDQYVKTREEKEVNQLKAYEKEQADIKHLQEFIRSCGTFSNLRRQADSKQKIIDKMKEDGLTEKPIPDVKFMFNFPETEKLPPPVLAFNDVSFSYSGRKEDYLYKDVSFGIDSDSCVALVGPNGAGKSTLLKLMRTDIDPCEGQVKRHSHLRIASYNQHSAEVLPLDKTPLEFMKEKYDAQAEQYGEQKKSEQEVRGKLGKYGIAGDLQKRKMSTFSDGQKARVVFALMSMANPHLLLLDEPTNHLDMACIDALAEAIKKFTGGCVLVSHDFRLIDQVAKEIWVCDGHVTPWKGDIKAYKQHLSKQMAKSSKARMSSCLGASAGSRAKAPEPSQPETVKEEEAAKPEKVTEVDEPPAKEEAPAAEEEKADTTPADEEEKAETPTADEEEEEEETAPAEEKAAPEPAAKEEALPAKEKAPAPDAKAAGELPPWLRGGRRPKK
eukprot:TRINITY_DN18463_c0_g1_i2.p1 TRINITY_DN18463_c0_g1~~TRINITY_DN18463_c0_g1_i2.p1  ORF type:complete len:727 (-),score=194.63 TRINITY_DN18463_c0_g1_i2:39-2219(-)